MIEDSLAIERSRKEGVLSGLSPGKKKGRKLIIAARLLVVMGKTCRDKRQMKFTDRGTRS